MTAASPSSPRAVYFDNNATTPCDRQVVAEMLPYFSEQFGNPSSIHSIGAGIGRLFRRPFAGFAVGGVLAVILFCWLILQSVANA